MPLHDVVAVNCKKVVTTELRAQVSSIWDKGVCWNIVCVLSDLT